MRFTLVRQTNLTQKGRQENHIYFCMHIIYIYTYLKLYMYINYTDIYVYNLYERNFFDVQHWRWGPKQKICIIIIYNMCISHCNANYICTWRSTSHMSIYIYIFDLHGPRYIQKTRFKLIAIEPKLIVIP